MFHMSIQRGVNDLLPSVTAIRPGSATGASVSRKQQLHSPTVAGKLCQGSWAHHQPLPRHIRAARPCPAGQYNIHHCTAVQRQHVQPIRSINEEMDQLGVQGLRPVTATYGQPNGLLCCCTGAAEQPMGSHCCLHAYCSNMLHLQICTGRHPSGPPTWADPGPPIVLYLPVLRMKACGSLL
jgi:hypothetical protein